MDMEIKLEDGTPSTSYANAFKMVLVHGPVVGITHLITPRDEHVTKLFFYDGQSHPAEGFAIGMIEEDTERYSRMMALFMVIQTIWGIDISSLSEKYWALEGKKELDKANEGCKNLVYVFLAPDESALKYVLQSDGLIACLDSSNFLEDDKNIVRIIE